ncbi:hypothetical protein K523DRAFT_411703 [Schizophyllum commune Tattone D]|nr:hypothetical protein K523DRAFT_411703 [Schizophyllum commune Tattone D]
MPSAYEKLKAANIEKNKALLISLGLEAATTQVFKDKPKPAPKPKPKKAAPKKRKEPPAREEDEGPDTKTQRVETVEAPSGVRRSARNAGKSVDYNAEHNKALKTIVSFDTGRTSKNTGKLGSEDGKPKYPKRYGAIPGIEVGTWWQGRIGCHADSVHAPLVAGISGNAETGAYSIALSGGYEDDVDLGEAFTYTGSGGRDLKGTKDKPKNLRTAPQSSDQDFDNYYNASLKKSCETKRPVRVIRGFKLHSPYAPAEGYRYDGLYTVEKAYREKGLQGFLVCKFALKRLPGQPPLPVRPDEDDESDKDEDKAKDEDESKDEDDTPEPGNDDEKENDEDEA